MFRVFLSFTSIMSGGDSVIQYDADVMFSFTQVKGAGGYFHIFIQNMKHFLAYATEN